ncbi:MAG: NlpC/P60 family protein [Bacteroides sp.]|nr:NlpC/P60 family protein [Bacteroides sp.]MCM1389791.1 NlpC/P60 family protein [Bacteroides sp.]
MTRFLLLILFCVVCCAEAVAQWALPHISVAHVRVEPRHGAEMSTQALMGMPLKIIKELEEGWQEVEMPDGYRGYVISNSLTYFDDEAFATWRSEPRLFVTSFEEVKVYEDTVAAAVVVSDVVAGDIMTGILSEGWSRVVIPDGRTGWIRSDYVKPLESVFVEDAAAEVIRMSKHHVGTPYLWGGLSSKGMDCSGLVKMAFYNTGRILLRDASQQAKTGSPVLPDDYRQGDLVFFGNASGRINHVGIYDSEGYFVESSGRVRRTALVDKPGYICARRVIGNEGSYGIVAINNHPWYFSH